MSDLDPDDLDRPAMIRAMGRAFLRAEYSAWKAVRFARELHARYGDAFLDRLDRVEEGPHGEIRMTARPTGDPGMERSGAAAAGYFLAGRLIDRGMDFDEVRRQVMGKARILASAWAASDFDKALRRRAYRKGVEMAIGETP
jgi:hypothetical protein